MTRTADGLVANGEFLEEVGLGHGILKKAVGDLYRILDSIDNTLVGAGGFPLSETVELANLSSMIGNILGGAIAQNSEGALRRNGPHKYPDLLSNDPLKFPNIEIKMALEGNKPKGHLAKEGYYLTCRYVLCDQNGVFNLGKHNRGTTAYVWEIRCGYLAEEHFNISNTAGDSGKTAVVNSEGMLALKVVYVDLERAPFTRKSRTFSNYSDLVAAGF